MDQTPPLIIHQDGFVQITANANAGTPVKWVTLKEFMELPPPIGLKLTNTASLVELVETKVYGIPQPQPLAEKAEKFKAEHFPISCLKIGSYMVRAQYEAQLVGKCYYAKRKLVWELLERGLKRKIEIQWHDICGIRATIHQDAQGILQLELNQPPTFFQENDPKPRKHTIWTVSPDFTQGCQASINRRHYLEFRPGVLNSHLGKLLHCDVRLLQLSRGPFPTLDSPYFHSNLYQGIGISNFSNAYHHLHASNTHQSFPSIPATLLSSSQPFPSIPAPVLSPPLQLRQLSIHQLAPVTGICSSSPNQELVVSGQGNDDSANFSARVPIRIAAPDMTDPQSQSPFPDLSLEADPTYITNETTQFDCSNTGIYSLMTNASQEEYPATYAHHFSTEAGSLYTQAHHYVLPHQALHQNLNSNVPDPLHQHSFQQWSTDHQDYHA